jgi:hypothetical protein
VPQATRDSARCVEFSTTGLSPSLVQYSAASSNRSLSCRCPTTPTVKTIGLGSSRFARRYWGNRVFFLFLQLLRCFSSLRSLVLVYGFNQPCLGLPHSDIFGSMLASSSPKRFAGNRVLLRLCVPRYPPLALCSLTTKFHWCLFSSRHCLDVLPDKFIAMQFSRFSLVSIPAVYLVLPKLVAEIVGFRN